MHSLKTMAVAILAACSRECDPRRLLRSRRPVREICEGLLEPGALGVPGRSRTSGAMSTAELDQFLARCLDAPAHAPPSSQPNPPKSGSCESKSPEPEVSDAAAASPAVKSADERNRKRRRHARKQGVLQALTDVLLLLRPSRKLRGSHAWKLHRCAMQLAACKTLVMLGKRESAMPLLLALLRRARVLQDIYVQLECCLLLRQNAALRGDGQAFEEYAAETRRLRGLRDAETYAAELLQRHTLDVHILGRRRRALGNAATHYWANLNDLRRIHSGRSLETAYFQLRIQAAMALNNTAEALEQCSQYRAYLQTQPQITGRVQFLRLDLVRLHCLVHRADPAGIELGYKLCSEFDPGELNRAVARQQLAILALRLGDLQVALDCLNAADKNSELSGLPPLMQARWNLIKHNLACLQANTALRPCPQIQVAAMWEIRAAHLLLDCLCSTQPAQILAQHCSALLTRQPQFTDAPRSHALLQLFCEASGAVTASEVAAALSASPGCDEQEFLRFESLRPPMLQAEAPQPVQPHRTAEYYLRRPRPNDTPRSAVSDIISPNISPTNSPMSRTANPAGAKSMPPKTGVNMELAPPGGADRRHFSVSQSMINIIETSSW